MKTTTFIPTKEEIMDFMLSHEDNFRTDDEMVDLFNEGEPTEEYSKDDYFDDHMIHMAQSMGYAWIDDYSIWMLCEDDIDGYSNHPIYSYICNNLVK